MSALFLPQWLHCMVRTNTFYVMISDTEDGGKDCGQYVLFQVANYWMQHNYKRMTKISGVEGQWQSIICEHSHPKHTENTF